METEKIVYVEFGKLEEYIPEKGYVIRDMRMFENKAIIWLQKSNYLN